jgi:hypothetical protein
VVLWLSQAEHTQASAACLAIAMAPQPRLVALSCQF